MAIDKVLDPEKDPSPAGAKPTATLDHPKDAADRGLTLTVKDEVLVVADHRQDIGQYRLDGKSESPAALVELCGGMKTENALVDGKGRALLIFPGDLWGRYDILRFATCAKLPFEVRDGRRRAQRPELAPGGVRYETPTASG